METFRPVDPVHPAAAYIGGKRHLADLIVPRLEAVPHETYAEPFIGMGGIFLRRRWAARSEVINDISGDVTTLFRILQRHYPQFMETLKFQITSRRDFERLLATDPATLTDLERAARFLYLQRVAFGGKVAGRSFGVDCAAPARFDVTKLGPLLADIHERLAGVTIENLTCFDFIGRYDRPGTLFYLDPPYWGSEDDYGAGVFGRDDFDRLAERLARISGRFILSVNDVPETRRAFAAFELEAVTTTYTIAGRGRNDVAAELLVMGPSAMAFPRPRDLLSSL